MRFLYSNGNGVLITGGDRLVGMLRSAADGNGAEPGYWFLLLDLYQLRGLQTDFERTALAYALAAGASPPSWQAAVRPVIAPRSIDEKRDEPRYEPGPDLIELRGIMAGVADPQLRELEQFAAQRHYVNINLSRVARMDFACATGFATLVNALAAARQDGAADPAQRARPGPAGELRPGGRRRSGQAQNLSPAPW